MANKIVMPKLGLMMEEGTIEKWHKEEGEVVTQGDLLFSVQTEKLTNDIESEVEGVLRKILVAEGEVADCGAAVAIIGDEAEDISKLL